MCHTFVRKDLPCSIMEILTFSEYFKTDKKKKLYDHLNIVHLFLGELLRLHKYYNIFSMGKEKF